MAESTCIKCGNTEFELKLTVPKASAYKLWFVQCARCGSVVGVIDYVNIGHQVEKIAAKVGAK